jgi:hypothetical protein
MINVSKLIRSPADSVRRLASEHPEWIPVLDAATAVAAAVEESGGEFAGAWVLDELAKRGGPRWVPNLRILVSYELLEKSGPSTRGGRRAYYRMSHRRAIEEALAAWKATATPRRLEFVAVASSGDKPSDTARKSADLEYEPRSWR